MPTPHIETFVLGDYQTNCFVVTVPDAPQNANHCWIVDCGFQPQAMFDYIEDRGLTPVRLILTHAHCDHIAGVDAVLTRFGPLPLSIHEAEAGFCSDAMLNLSALIGMPITCTEPDHYFKQGDTFELNDTTWRIIHAPGHSPGCAAGSRRLRTGDCRRHAFRRLDRTHRLSHLRSRCDAPYYSERDDVPAG